MKIEQIYTPCLAVAAYYIESDGEAAVVDPVRDIEPYLDLASKNRAQIKYVFETRIHGDFVSGHLDLERRAGTKVVFGPGAKTAYDKHNATAGEIFQIGKLALQVLHTPGPALESSCVLLHDPSGIAHCIFTGDILLFGDACRSDLALTDKSLLHEDMARLHYQSLRRELAPLPDTVIVCPSQGPGSAYGTNISAGQLPTIGTQRTSKGAFAIENQDDFVTASTAQRDPAPPYFCRNLELNRGGYEDLRVVRERALRRLDPEVIKTTAGEDTQILDIRSSVEFADGHFPCSLNIGIDGMFEVWVSILIEDARRPLIIVGPEKRVEEAIVRLARIGFDNIVGFLDSGLLARKLAGSELNRVETINANELERLYENQALNILDCRTSFEFGAMHVDNAISFPLSAINENLHLLDQTSPYYIHCKSGYRSMAAASILLKLGFQRIIDVRDGFDGLLETKIPRSGSLRDAPPRSDTEN